MPQFSNSSMTKLSTCHKDLQQLFNIVIKNYDCTILEGHRNQKRQEELLKQGKSKTEGSKHLLNPSMAIDVAPCPIPKNWGENDFKEIAKFYHFAGYVLGKASNLGIKIRWGGDWNNNNNFNDQTFDDLIHFELA